MVSHTQALQRHQFFLAMDEARLNLEYNHRLNLEYNRATRELNMLLTVSQIDPVEQSFRRLLNGKRDTSPQDTSVPVSSYLSRTARVYPQYGPSSWGGRITVVEQQTEQASNRLPVWVKVWELMKNVCEG